MTDGKPAEDTPSAKENVRHERRLTVEPALPPTQPEEGAESAPSSEVPPSAPEAPAVSVLEGPELAEPSPELPPQAALSEPALAEVVPESRESEPEAQSKFAGPASTLGIRSPIEQSKAGTVVSSGLGSIQRRVLPSQPPFATGPAPRPGTLPSPSFVPPASVPPTPVVPSAPPVVPAPPVPPAVATTPEAAEEEPSPTWAERFRRLSPALVTLSIGSIGALAFLVYAVTSHTTPVPVLLSAGVVVTLAFAADAVIASIATWRAAVEEDPGRALLLAIAAGGSAIVCATALGATTVLLLVISGL